MSSSNEDTIYEIVTSNINTIGRIFLVAFGSLGAIFNLCVFIEHRMRKNIYSIYMIAFNIANLCFIWLSLFPLIINEIFKINPALYNLIYYRFYYYLSYTLTMICPSYLILASIDRILISSRNALTRQKSTKHLALSLIIGATFLWFIFYIQFWFKINMILFPGGLQFCYFDLGIYSYFINYSSIILSGLLPPFIMLICFLKILKNLGASRTVRGENEQLNRQITQRNRQLILMLSTEICLYIIFSLMQPIYLSYIQSSPFAVTSEEQIFRSFILAIANFLSHIPSCTSFYSNIICSNNFRKQIIEILIKINPFKQLMRNRQIIPDHTGRIRGTADNNEHF